MPLKPLLKRREIKTKIRARRCALPRGRDPRRSETKGRDEAKERERERKSGREPKDARKGFRKSKRRVAERGIKNQATRTPDDDD